MITESYKIIETGITGMTNRGYSGDTCFVWLRYVPVISVPKEA
ncbi:MAG: hypothetical protein RR225_00870 [Clostridium sp.]